MSFSCTKFGSQNGLEREGGRGIKILYLIERSLSDYLPFFGMRRGEGRGKMYYSHIILTLTFAFTPKANNHVELWAKETILS